MKMTSFEIPRPLSETMREEEVKKALEFRGLSGCPHTVTVSPRGDLTITVYQSEEEKPPILRQYGSCGDS